MRISKLIPPEKLQNVVYSNGDLSAIDVRVSVYESKQKLQYNEYLLDVARSLIDQLHLKYLYVHKEGNEIFIIFNIHAEIKLGAGNNIKFEV